MSKNPHIGIVIGSTRQGRFSERAAAWFHKIAAPRTDLSFEIIDLRDYPMPFFDEPASPAWMTPKDKAAERWAAKLAELDGFVFVTPEYNHGYSAVLKNALDYAFQQFNRKPAAFALAIIGAEYVAKILPRGTHEYLKFIRPAELARWARAAGLEIKDLAGISYNPLTRSFRLSDNTDVNYLAHFIRPTR